MLTTATRSNQDRHVFSVALLGLAAMAWLALALWGASPYARYLDHGVLAHTNLTDVKTIGLLVAGWTLMCVAMMLPTALPLVNLFRGLVRRRNDSRLLIVWLTGGYLLVWAIYGLAAHIGDWLLHKSLAQWFWLLVHPWIISVVVLTLAGIYQFTPLKYHCLDSCRSPFSFMIARWHGLHPHWEALRLGVDHGLYCLGCCWSLMLVMFVVRMGNLGWMFVLGAVMGVEKNLPWGRRLVTPLGVALVLGASALLLLNLGR